jgi:hypothetical protein
MGQRRRQLRRCTSCRRAFRRRSWSEATAYVAERCEVERSEVTDEDVHLFRDDCPYCGALSRPVGRERVTSFR